MADLMMTDVRYWRFMDVIDAIRYLNMINKPALKREIERLTLALNEKDVKSALDAGKRHGVLTGMQYKDSPHLKYYVINEEKLKSFSPSSFSTVGEAAALDYVVVPYYKYHQKPSESNAMTILEFDEGDSIVGRWICAKASLGLVNKVKGDGPGEFVAKKENVERWLKDPPKFVVKKPAIVVETSIPPEKRPRRHRPVVVKPASQEQLPLPKVPLVVETPSVTPSQITVRMAENRVRTKFVKNLEAMREEIRVVLRSSPRVPGYEWPLGVVQVNTSWLHDMITKIEETLE